MNQTHLYHHLPEGPRELERIVLPRAAQESRGTLSDCQRPTYRSQRSEERAAVAVDEGFLSEDTRTTARILQCLLRRLFLKSRSLSSTLKI